MGMGSAEGGPHRGISLLPHLLLHLKEKQRDTGGQREEEESNFTRHSKFNKT